MVIHSSCCKLRLFGIKVCNSRYMCHYKEIRLTINYIKNQSCRFILNFVICVRGSLHSVWEGDIWIMITFCTYNGGCKNISTLCSQRLFFVLLETSQLKFVALHNSFLVFFYLRKSVCER